MNVSDDSDNEGFRGFHQDDAKEKMSHSMELRKHLTTIEAAEAESEDVKIEYDSHSSMSSDDEEFLPENMSDASEESGNHYLALSKV